MKKNVLSVLLGLVMLLTLTVGASAATELPSGYTAVDYVRSAGEGAIDTGYATSEATSSYSYEIKFAYESATVTGANQTMLGVSAGNARSGLLIARTSGNGGDTAIIFGTDQATSNYDPVSYESTEDETVLRVDIDMVKNTYTITKNGTTLVTNRAINGTPDSAATIYAFACHSSSTGSSFITPASGNIYYLKMWQDGDLVRNFVPAKNSSGVYGLYDLVKENFHQDVKTASNILGPKEVVYGAYDIYFTAPEGMSLTIRKGFSDTGDKMDRYELTTENGVSTHHYKLDAGSYRFCTKGGDYYRLHKNFVVTAAKNGTTINADPGKQTGKGWEQSNDCPWPIYQFADEVVNSAVYKLKDSVYTDYPDAFSTPTFTNTGKTAYEFTSDPEMVAFAEQLQESCANMYDYYLGVPDSDGYDIYAVVFTTTDLSGAATLEDAAALVMANGKPTVHLQAQIHGSEQSATEGALGIMKTLAGTYGEEALEKINVVVMPRINTKGSKDYTYGPKDGPDLNLDYYKMTDTLGRTQAIVGVYNMFQPEVVIDLHECRYSYGATNGRQSDLKMATIENLNIPQQMHELHDVYFAEIFEAAAAEGIYGDYYREDPPNNKPVSGRGNYFTRGGVSILLEIPGQRSGKMLWDRRIFAQYIGVKAILDYTVENADAVKATVKSTKEDIIEAGTYFDPENNLITLHHVEGDKTQTYPMPTVDFTTGAYIDANATRSVYKYNKAALTRPRPLAYVVSKDSANIEKVLEICRWQNVKYEEISADRVIELKQYGGTAWKNNDASTGESGTTLGEAKLMSFPNGAYLFPMNQATGVVLSLLMEPDVIDTRDAGSPCSFSQQGLLTNAEIYRCEDLSEHALTYVPAADATCTENGNIEHWLCTCGKGFASEEHAKEISWIIPKTGHNFVQQFDGASAKFVCENNCGEENVSLNKVLAACDGVGGTVKVMGNINTESLVVPTGVTLDLDTHTLAAEKLTVNEGGKIVNGSLSVSSTATVNLGSNGGCVPVYTGTSGSDKVYDLYPIATKVGQAVSYVGGGVKYAFGYKYADHAAYAASVTANETGLKFGVALDLDELSADHSFSPDSVAKMTEVSNAADAFYRVNLSIVGDGAENVTVTPYVKLLDLGFRYEGESRVLSPVAEVGNTTYNSLETAVEAAKLLGDYQEIRLIGDVSYASATTIKTGGNIRFVVDGTNDITISGPVTFDGENLEGICMPFRVTGYDGSALALEGVTIQNYNNLFNGGNHNRTYGAVIRADNSSKLTLKRVNILNNSCAVRGAVYITHEATAIIEDSEFVGNTALNEYGGAIAIYGGTNVTVKNSTFTGNSCVGSSSNFSGAIHAKDVPLTVDGCTFSGNSAEKGDDIGVTTGTLTLKGTTKMGEVYLNSGKSITLGDTFALAEGADPIVIDGALGSTVLTGDAAIVAANNDCFVGPDGETVTDEGVLGEVIAGSVFEVRTDAELTSAIASAQAQLAASDVEIVLLADVNLSSAVTLGGTNKLTIRLAEGDTAGKKITLGTSAAITTAGEVEILGNSAAAQIILDGNNASSTLKNRVVVGVGKTLSMQYVTLQNCKSTASSSAPIHVDGTTSEGGVLKLDYVTIQQNEAKMGGIFATRKGEIYATNCTFTGNTATGTNGGVIYLAYATCKMEIDNCVFSGNSNTNTERVDYGSAIDAIGAVTIKNTKFLDNSGGALTTGVVHVRLASSNVTVENCTFSGNTSAATNAAAVYVKNGTATVKGCAFENQTIKDTYKEAGTLTVTQ